LSLEECKAPCGPANHEAIGELMDGRGEVAGALARSERQGAMLLDQLRFQREVLAEIFELSDPRATTPHQNMQMIHGKALVAIQAAAKSGLLS
jgi:hypothetical protein